MNNFEIEEKEYKKQIKNIEGDIISLESNIKKLEPLIKNPALESIKFVAIFNLIIEAIILIPNNVLSHLSVSTIIQMVGTYMGLTIFTFIPAICKYIKTKKDNKKYEDTITSNYNEKFGLEAKLKDIKHKLEELKKEKIVVGETKNNEPVVLEEQKEEMPINTDDYDVFKIDGQTYYVLKDEEINVNIDNNNVVVTCGNGAKKRVLTPQK